MEVTGELGCRRLTSAFIGEPNQWAGVAQLLETACSDAMIAVSLSGKLFILA
jgi:hypothetical protein